MPRPVCTEAAKKNLNMATMEVPLGRQVSKMEAAARREFENDLKNLRKESAVAATLESFAAGSTKVLLRGLPPTLPKARTLLDQILGFYDLEPLDDVHVLDEEAADAKSQTDRDDSPLVVEKPENPQDPEDPQNRVTIHLGGAFMLRATSTIERKALEHDLSLLEYETNVPVEIICREDGAIDDIVLHSEPNSDTTREAQAMMWELLRFHEKPDIPAHERPWASKSPAVWDAELATATQSTRAGAKRSLNLDADAAERMVRFHIMSKRRRMQLGQLAEDDRSTRASRTTEATDDDDDDDDDDEHDEDSDSDSDDSDEGVVTPPRRSTAVVAVRSRSPDRKISELASRPRLLARLNEHMMKARLDNEERAPIQAARKRPFDESAERRERLRDEKHSRGSSLSTSADRRSVDEVHEMPAKKGRAVLEARPRGSRMFANALATVKRQIG